MKVEVRCCCMPGKLLGYIDMGEHWPLTTRYVAFPAPSHTGQFDRIELELATLNDGFGHQYTAFKSGHMPVETLRRIGAFREPTATELLAEIQKVDDRMERERRALEERYCRGN